jgi:glyoxylase-like metal-dependent hydrolase (beta-lactamase superfamily II)
MTTHYADEEITIYKVKCAPYDNNAYLLVCPKTNESIIIDTPADHGELIRSAKDSDVKAILITHNHSDHIQGLTQVTSTIPCPVGIGEADAGALPKPPGRFLKDGDIVTAGTIVLQALSTPGHTPGSTCFVVGKHLFSGDTLFPGGPGRSGSPQDLALTIDSITKKLFVLSDVAIFHPGHGEDGDIKTAKQEYAVFESKDHPANLYGDVLWLRD